MKRFLSKTLLATVAATVFMAGCVTAQPADAKSAKTQQITSTQSGPKLNYEIVSEHCTMTGPVSFHRDANKAVIECTTAETLTMTITLDKDSQTYNVDVSGPSATMSSSGNNMDASVSMSGTKVKVSVFPAK